MKKSFEIDGRTVSQEMPPYIIAELSGNHNGDIAHAFSIMGAAKKAGADAIKIQTYTADTITIDHDSPEFVVDLPLWKNRTLYDLYGEASTPWEWHEALFKKAKEIEITLFSSPFDFSAVDFLEELNAPAYKVASPEIVDIPLIEKMARTGKPIIMSTGMANLDEIQDAVAAARKAGCEELALLHCVSAYPTPSKDAFLSNILELSNKFDVIVGLSDHSLGISIPIAATALGASIIEKHFTLARSDGGVDSAFSIEPAELESMVLQSRDVKNAIGTVQIGPKESELKGLNYRRSLYVVKDIKKGEAFSDENIRSIRPGHGLKPKFHQEILGKIAKVDIAFGTPLSWSLIES